MTAVLVDQKFNIEEEKEIEEYKYKVLNKIEPKKQEDGSLFFGTFTTADFSYSAYDLYDQNHEYQFRNLIDEALIRYNTNMIDLIDIKEVRTLIRDFISKSLVKKYEELQNNTGPEYTRLNYLPFNKLGNSTYDLFNHTHVRLRYNKNNKPYVVETTIKEIIGINANGKVYKQFKKQNVIIHKLNKYNDLIETNIDIKTKSIASMNKSLFNHTLNSYTSKIPWIYIMLPYPSVNIGRDYKLNTTRRQQLVNDIVIKYLYDNKIKDETSYFDLYPVLKEYEGKLFKDTPKEILYKIRNIDNVQDFTKALFGKKRYRKDLVKAIANSDMKAISIVWALTNPKTPTDWIVSLLNNEDFKTECKKRYIDPSAGGLTQFKRIISKLDLASTRKLFISSWKTKPDQKIHALSDSIRVYAFKCKDVRLTRVDSIIDLENQLTRIYNERINRAREINRLKAEAKNKKLQAWYETPNGIAYLNRLEEARIAQILAQKKEQEEREAKMRESEKTRMAAYDTINAAFTKFNTDKSNSYKLIIAKDTETLQQWSSYMGNCIGGYEYAMSNFTSILAGLYDNKLANKDNKTDGLIANIEIRIEHDGNTTLSQFLGKYNKKISNNTKNPIIEYFKSLNIDCQQYWGE